MILIEQIDVDEYVHDLTAKILQRMNEKGISARQVCLSANVAPATFTRFLRNGNKNGIGLIGFIKILAALDLEIELIPVKSLEK